MEDNRIRTQKVFIKFFSLKLKRIRFISNKHYFYLKMPMGASDKQYKDLM